MIIARLNGGLGNQLFEYAAARNLSLKHDTELVLDLSWYKREGYYANTRRNYELDQFTIVGQATTKPSILSPHPLQLALARRPYVRRIAGAWSKVQRPSRAQLALTQFIQADDDATFRPEVIAAPDNSVLFGTWQNERYFHEHREQIRSELQFKHKPGTASQRLISQMQSQTSVSLHIRRSDYAHDPQVQTMLAPLPMDYYDRAISEMNGTLKNPYYYIFSDDLEWCQANLKLSAQHEFVTHNMSGVEDLRLMASCKHNIIANSSFSWWGAWLNAHPDKKVIGPTKWFTRSTLNKDSMLAAGWIGL